MASSRTIPTYETPQITIVIPAFNAERYLRISIRSALAQTIDRLEVLVVDDGSTDTTATIVKQEAGLDGRVRLECMGRNSGASAARNRGFALARGQWIAVLDSDDLMAPGRLERLVHEGNRHDVDIVADNLVRFSSADEALTPVLAQTKDFEIDAKHYLLNNKFFQNSLHYGLLQPIFRSAALVKSGEAYDECLRFGEDDEFHLRLLLKGLRFRVHGSIGYFYRQHDSSVSRRTTKEDVLLMTESSRRLVDEFRDHPLADLLAKRHRAFERAADYLDLIAALKRKDILEAARIVAARPSSLPLLHTPLLKAVRRVIGPAQTTAEHPLLRAILLEAMRSAGEQIPGDALTDVEGSLQMDKLRAAQRS